MKSLAWLLAAVLALSALAPAVAARDDGPEDCDPEKEAWNEAAGECEDLPEEDDSSGSDGETAADCDAEKERWNASTQECEDLPEAEDGPDSCKDDEAWNATTQECEDLPETEDGPDSCKDDEAWNATIRECEDLPDADDGPASCDEDEVWNATRGDCDDLDDDRGRDDDECVETETEYEEETTLPNGTEYEEKVKEKVLDCPGTENDSVEVEREVRWKEDSEEDDGRDRRVETREKVKIERDGDRVEVVIEHRAVERAPAFDLRMKDNASVFEVVEPGNDTPALTVNFLEVVEFEDTNGDSAYDLDDVVLNSWRVEALGTNATSGDDGRVVVTYALPPGGTLSFVHYPAEEGRAKFDIVIDGFAYASNASQLALRSAFTAEGASYRRDLPNPALVTEVDGKLAYFDWIDVVDADGEERPVVATVYVGEGAAAGTAQLYLSYPRGDRIVHDPSVGMTVMSTVAVVVETLLHPAAYVAASAAAAAFVAAGYMARRRF